MAAQVKQDEMQAQMQSNEYEGGDGAEGGDKSADKRSTGVKMPGVMEKIQALYVETEMPD